MRLRQHIKKIGIITLWIAFASGMLVLLIAAMEEKEYKKCSKVEIDITGAGDYDFLDRQEVMSIIRSGKNDKLEGKSLASFNLQQLEEKLERNVWVKDAELFFDNNIVLHIHIKEREPIAVIFTQMGNSFYIDSSGKKLPLSDKVSISLPVFTGFTAENTTGLNKTNKQLLADIKTISLFLLKDTSWMKRIVRTDIGIGNNFQMLPDTGNHIIDFGSAANYEDKFRRLSLFYTTIISKTGFDKYSRIDVRFDKQVIGTRKGSNIKMDSLQTMKNIQKMIADATKIPDDSLFTSVEKNNAVINKADSTLPVLKKVNTTITRQPKAVMSKKKKQ